MLSFVSSYRKKHYKQAAMILKMDDFSLFNYISKIMQIAISGFTVLIPDYYRGEPAKREWFFNGQIRSWMQKQTKWENLGRMRF